MIGLQVHTAPPEEKYPYVCDICGEGVEHVEAYGMDLVCDECREEYLERAGADFVEEYVAENFMDFVCNWWWEGLPEKERQAAIYDVFKKKFPWMTEDSRATEKAEYCMDSEGFPEFVERQLKAG